MQTTLRSDGVEWVESAVSEDTALRDSKNVLIEVSVSGAANAAGLSFGAFKDFLVPVTRDQGERRLQLEIDGAAKTWAFRADGVLMGREWWDDAIGGVDDLFDGMLRCKARWAEEAVFSDLSVRALDSSPRISVVMACHRFAQRLRVALTSWCRQRVASGALEIVVVNPASPDGTHELIASMAAAYPEIRLREIPADARRARNKGYLLNRGIEASRGEWVWVTDADCVFPPDAAGRLLKGTADPATLHFGERRHLPRSTTDLLLAGRVDASSEFGRIAKDAGAVDAYPWGYTQIVHRSRLGWLRFPENQDRFAGYEEPFLDAWRKAGLAEARIDGLTCLHLAHPFSWNGTERFL